MALMCLLVILLISYWIQYKQKMFLSEKRWIKSINVYINVFTVA